MSTRLDAVLRANPMALPMHLRSAEVALNNSTLLSVEKRGPDALRAEATFIRQQLALHASYVNACGNIEAFSDAMRGSTAHLVPLRFPIRLTQKTRECVEDGMFRSFLRFLQDLHGLVLEQHEGGVDDAVTGVDAFLTRLANVLTLESCRVLDGIVHSCEARNVCLSYIEKCQLEVVRKESCGMWWRSTVGCAVARSTTRALSASTSCSPRRTASWRRSSCGSGGA